MSLFNNSIGSRKNTERIKLLVLQEHGMSDAKERKWIKNGLEDSGLCVWSKLSRAGLFTLRALWICIYCTEELLTDWANNIFMCTTLGLGRETTLHNTAHIEKQQLFDGTWSKICLIFHFTPNPSSSQNTWKEANLHKPHCYWSWNRKKTTFKSPKTTRLNQWMELSLKCCCSDFQGGVEQRRMNEYLVLKDSLTFVTRAHHCW